VVTTKFNQAIPTPVRFVQPADPALNQNPSLHFPAFLRRYPDNFIPIQAWVFRRYRSFLRLSDAVRSPGRTRA
jgi:hypothetical protein